MTPRNHRVRACAASALLGGALVAIGAVAQTPPATTKQDTSDDCRQLTGTERKKCEERLSAAAAQTDPNSVNSTTRSAPNSANPSNSHAPAPAKPADQAHASTAKDKKPSDADASKAPNDRSSTRVQPPKKDDDEEEEDNATRPDDEDDEEDAPPPDTESDADSDSDTQDPPRQR